MLIVNIKIVAYFLENFDFYLYTLCNKVFYSHTFWKAERDINFCPWNFTCMEAKCPAVLFLSGEGLWNDVQNVQSWTVYPTSGQYSYAEQLIRIRSVNRSTEIFATLSSLNIFKSGWPDVSTEGVKPLCSTPLTICVTWICVAFLYASSVLGSVCTGTRIRLVMRLYCAVWKERLVRCDCLEE
jgi:hypothetical protein